MARRDAMLLLFAMILLLMWAMGFFLFHLTGFLIHVLLVCAVISLALHFASGRRTA